MTVRHPARWAYATGIAGTVANLLLIGFYAFQVGRPEAGVSLGSANDLVGALSSALMIPVAVALGGPLARTRGTTITQACGMAAMVVIAVTGPLLVFGALSFDVQLPMAMVAALVLFGWVFLISRALRSVPGWAKPVARLGQVVAAVALIGALLVVGGLALPWGSVPQLIVMGIGGSVGLVGWLGIPVWFLLVGRQFARAGGKRTARLATSIARIASEVHVWLYRRTDGRRGGTINGVPHLLLTTTGRRTGLARTRPIGYHRDGDRLIVAASNGGSDVMPAWVFNLRSDPVAEVQIGADTFAVRASEMTGDDYQRRWAQLTGRYPVYLRYPKKTKRHIPVMVLEPVDAKAVRAVAAGRVHEEEK